MCRGGSESSRAEPSGIVRVVTWKPRDTPPSGGELARAGTAPDAVVRLRVGLLGVEATLRCCVGDERLRGDAALALDGRPACMQGWHKLGQIDTKG
jgi:hypothetical protein